MAETKDLVRACDLAVPSEIGRVYQTIEGQKQLTFKRRKAIIDGARFAGVLKFRKVEEDATNVLFGALWGGSLFTKCERASMVEA